MINMQTIIELLDLNGPSKEAHPANPSEVVKCAEHPEHAEHLLPP